MQHFILEEDLFQKSVTLRSPDLLHQMIQVLRFKVGDECMVLDGKGQKAKAKIEVLHKKEAKLLLSEQETCEPPQQRIHLACAIPKKPSTFEWILQKAAELGVSEIIPLVTSRCQVHELRKVQRLELILKEATEQSERCFLPALRDVIKLGDLLSLEWPVLAGDARDFDFPLRDYSSKNSDLVVVIGPEGGLTQDELQLIRKKGGQIFGLGEEVLRMETAALAALSVLRFGLPN